MSTHAKERVSLFTLTLDAFSVGTKTFFFVVLLYLLATNIAAFIVGQAQANIDTGNAVGDPLLLMWADRLTGWFSIAVFIAFVALSNTWKDGGFVRPQLVDVFVMGLGALLPQIGYNIGWSLQYMNLHTGNVLMQQFALSPTLALVLGLAGCFAGYLINVLMSKSE